MASEQEKIVYLDNNATTAVAPEVVEAMRPYFEAKYWNPSSMYAPALALARELGDARATVARLLGAQFADEIVFTSLPNAEVTFLVLNSTMRLGMIPALSA